MGGPTALGLSSGNEAHDIWGEKLNRGHRVPTRFYNCFIDPETAEDGTPYQLISSCLGPETAEADTRSYEALDAVLADRPALSVHLRLDTEVSGWSVFDKLLESDELQGKLRTLDVDFHLANKASFDTEIMDLSEQDLLDHQVKVMEKLLKHFHVVGSTLEVYRMGWHPEQDCPEQQCNEPPVYLNGGFPPQRVAVSYAKRELASVGGEAEKAEEDSAVNDVGGEEAEAVVEEAFEETAKTTYKMPKSTCVYEMPDQVSSRPGPPCLPGTPIWPYVTNTPWRSAVGERIIRAVTPDITGEECDGWHMFGDQTWCNKAMKSKTALALSFGIEERDLYSEYMSNHYHLPTKLFDCFIETEKSPPMAGTAPNAAGPCDTQNGGHCYETKYESFRICLGNEATEIDGRQYDTLSSLLVGRGPLSTHVKIDVEGSEWSVLEALLASDEDQAKIRTLDMEIHFGFRAASEASLNHLSEKERLDREVGIIEGLSKNFRVTGTTLETYRQGWFPNKDCPEQQCHEPIVHTAGGFSPQMFAISFVNKAFWKSGVSGKVPKVRAAAVADTTSDEEETPAPAPRNRRRPAPAPASAPETASEGGEVQVAKTKAEVKAEAKAARAKELKRNDNLPYPGGKPPCKYLLPDQVSSRPGPPCIPPARIWPYVTNTPWRSMLGERIVESIDQSVSSEQCGGWHMFGDQTWCNKAMKKTPGVLALSFGIEERDLFSEYMSNYYRVPTKLYDCFIEPEKSPPMAGTAPNATKKCDQNSGHCYETPYQSYRVCLGPERVKVHGRQYITLADTLKGRGPLSTHVKIDVEGSEWTVLEQLIASDTEQAKIRTLDMEIHFGFRAASEAAYDDFPEEERILRQIKIIEGLRKRFYCSGTTLETYRQGWWPEKDCTVQQCHEPVVHTLGAFSPQMFAVSYVNKAIIDGPGGVSAETGDAPAAEETQHEEEAPVPAPRSKPRPRLRTAPAAAPAPVRAAASAIEEDEEGEGEEGDGELVPGPGPKCTYKMPNAHSSRPGKPCLPAAKKWPYKSNTKWRTRLGERIVRAATPQITAEACGGFTLFGDQTWCNNAFKRKGNLALSFGIEERDMYSEYMSNTHKIKTRLFDCFQNPASSPPMSGKAKNGTRSCGGQGHCYETTYQSFPVCLGPKKETRENRQYDTLENALKGRGLQSTHVKIDVEGSEWTVLENLAKNDEDQDKIITLDMEIHFGWSAASEADYSGRSGYDRIKREIEILESLSRKFHVTGTTLEEYRQGWLPTQDCPNNDCNEPVVHLAGGFSPQMFAISFINKRVLSGDQGGEAAGEEPEAAENEAAPEPQNNARQVDELDRSFTPTDPSPSAKYGFYLHVFNAPAAVIHQVRQLKKHFPGSPVYIMSDGGFSFKELCRVEGCKFALCPPANDRWHPWPFLRRMYDAALYLDVEYIIMLEPDNTVHGPITREPKADAGGLPVKDRKFGYREYAEKLARKKKPGYRWTDRAMSAGLAGGAYFRRAAILDAFSDESVAEIDWNYLGESATKEVYSSDFAMQYLLASRAYEMEPWEDCAQMDRHKDNPISGAKDSAFRHYCGCYPGGKPTYNLAVKPADLKLFQDPLPKHTSDNSNCQICYNLTKYLKDWGSARCTNSKPFAYSKLIYSRYFPDGKIPQIR